MTTYYKAPTHRTERDGIALIFARTETEGFVREVWGKADAVLFLHGRLNFHRAGRAPSPTRGRRRAW